MSKLTDMLDRMFGMEPTLLDEDNVTAATADQETYIGDVPYDNVSAPEQVDTGLVPVQLLQDVPLVTVERAARGFATHGEFVTSTAIRIVQRNLRRRAVMLYGSSANTKIICIGPNEWITAPTNGARIGTTPIILTTTSEIWAVSEDATQQFLSVIELTEDG